MRTHDFFQLLTLAAIALAGCSKGSAVTPPACGACGMDGGSDSGSMQGDSGTIPDGGMPSDGSMPIDGSHMSGDSGPMSDGGTPQPTFPITAAFYYGWYPETWTVGGAHVSYHPTLGYYSTTDAATQTAHIDALVYAGMKAAISSWWGPTHYTDTRLGQLMARTVSMGAPLKWAIYYEQEGSNDPSASEITSDLTHVRDTLASSPAYLRVDGKFVVFVYNANDMTCDVATRWKQANDAIGDAAYIDLKVFPGYRTCADQPDSWHQYGPDSPSDDQSGYSYTIAAGFWRADEASPRLARDPTRWAGNVSDMAASGEPWQLVTTFNEWGEGTAIESADEWASSSGYGTYLDALHATFGSP